MDSISKTMRLPQQQAEWIFKCLTRILGLNFIREYVLIQWSNFIDDSIDFYYLENELTNSVSNWSFFIDWFEQMMLIMTHSFLSFVLEEYKNKENVYYMQRRQFQWKLYHDTECQRKCKCSRAVFYRFFFCWFSSIHLVTVVGCLCSMSFLTNYFTRNITYTSYELRIV